MSFFKWSKTAANDATADPSAPWPEGMAPSQVNDSARGMMAALRKFGDDISGAIVTTGTSTAYAVSSNQGFASLATDLNNQMIAFVPHTTNGATVTLSVDGLPAKPLRSAPGTELLAGVLIQGTPYLCTYSNADGAFYLRGFFGNPYNIPLGGMLPFVLPTAPNSSFVFPFGQAISRTTYAALFAAMGTTYGVGDGSTTFNLPDYRGRVPAGVDNMGGVAAGRLTAASSMGTGLLGQAGGGESQTLTLAQLPTGITSRNPASLAISVASNLGDWLEAAGGTSTSGGGLYGVAGTIFSSGTIAINAINVTSTNTLGNAHPIVQPTVCCNFILRII